MTIIGLFIFLAFVVAGLGDNLTAMIDVPSILIVSLGTLGMMLMSFGHRWLAGLRVLRRSGASRDEIELGHAMLCRLRSFVVAAGAWGSFIGVVMMSKYMDDPANVGPGISMLLLTQVWSLLLAFGVVQPLVSSLAGRLEDMDR